MFSSIGDRRIDTDTPLLFDRQMLPVSRRDKFHFLLTGTSGPGRGVDARDDRTNGR